MSTEKIGGYVAQSPDNIRLVNQNKVMEEQLLRRVEDLKNRHAADGRWCAVAMTHFQEGFMALNRAVMQPTRLSDESLSKLRESGL